MKISSASFADVSSFTNPAPANQIARPANLQKGDQTQEGADSEMSSGGLFGAVLPCVAAANVSAGVPCSPGIVNAVLQTAIDRSALAKDLLGAAHDLQSQDKLGNFEIQSLMSQFNEAQTLASSIEKEKYNALDGVPKNLKG